MKQYLILLTCFLLFSSVQLNAQKKYQELEIKNGISFSYKIKPIKCFKKNSPLMVVFKIENKNNYVVNTQFIVDYYYKAIICASSEKQDFCIKPQKTLKGRIKKLAFDNSDLSNDEIISEDFIIELSEIVVTKVDKCK